MACYQLGYKQLLNGSFHKLREESSGTYVFYVDGWEGEVSNSHAPHSFDTPHSIHLVVHNHKSWYISNSGRYGFTLNLRRRFRGKRRVWKIISKNIWKNRKSRCFQELRLEIWDLRGISRKYLENIYEIVKWKCSKDADDLWYSVYSESVFFVKGKKSIVK